ncbi:pyruvate:ferredoxin (flavodoxin) oxidoreductase [Clostridium sp. FP2]|uniref:pyruvate:ferredoxin (flavodoxin) oxidoreductase n=1 Tax=Clostridium sp. FP2 TaxID=2724481 RepID=UPI0013E92F05|nr:pyruvate:ferredoxin (flavodoxin) oxidoreductase [Clostridium sp. FP2]MBZ9626013.1 pyruvate:ferredoxin (flavodoxin) oxidoreductase [Clostridium sp. FP2]
MNSNNKVMKTMDGNEACATVAYQFTEVAGIYPITPSSPMAEKTDEWASEGRKNMFGQPVTLVEMQSEAGACGAVHGALEAGALATTFTSSQGLMLMIPCLHIIAGHRHPGVLHVAARSVGTHANSIFGDHQDVMDCRATGFAMLASGSVQAVMDLAGVAHLSAIKARIPFIHFFDGFRTSHEVQKIEMIDLDKVTKLVDIDALEAWRAVAMNPEHPSIRTTVQGPDVYFQNQEANNPHYDGLPEVVEAYLEEINKITGRDYHLFNYYGAKDADRLIVAMGSVCETARETVEYLNNKGEKVGLLEVHLYRPFSVEYFLKAIPNTVKKIAVLDRSKEPGSIGEALYVDVCATYTNNENAPKIYGGRYGLSSKDTNPAQIKAVFDNLKNDEPKNNFTIGIVDDVTFLSLDSSTPIVTESRDTVSCKFWGLGSDGTIGANKNSAKIIGDHTDMYTQAYFEYDTKKSYGITKSHLRFSKNPIRSTYLVKAADLLACHNETYLDKYDMIHEIKDGGTFLLNCSWKEEELTDRLPLNVKKYIADHNINFYIVDANKISNELGLGNRANMILQAAFFALTKVIPIEDAVKYMKEAVKRTYAKKGEKVVNMNLNAVDSGITSPIKVNVPESWSSAKVENTMDEDLPDMIKNIVIPVNRQRGDDLPVSTFIGHEDGTFKMGTTAFEKRGIATEIPVWDASKCLQCNQCSYVCPHAAIRPYLLDAEEVNNAPENFSLIDANGAAANGMNYTLQVSTLNCTGCGSCAASCPAKEKALKMVVAGDWIKDTTNWDYALNISDKGDLFDVKTVKGSQFRQPLLEFSGACAGCGETPYAKLITQLYGDKAYWVNAIGCSMAWAAAMPSFPYTTNKKGHGPSYVCSLFENQAEAGLGMFLGVKQRRNGVKMQALNLLTMVKETKLEKAINEWLETFDSLRCSDPTSEAMSKALKDAKLDGEAKTIAENMLLHRDQFTKKSIWLFGGDGWAYDIGFGGLDHVIASGEDINIFVVDTELYSNTGGQASKATPIGANAKFADSGKKTQKKDLGRQMMTYGNTYVAQVAMGADRNQLIKALTEAEEHKGPSLIIAYAPCISHGIKAGMSNVQNEMKKAVDAGLWTLYRFNPDKREKPFTLDSKAPTKHVKEFFDGETRYASLKMKYPELAEKLFAEAQKAADEHYKSYVRLEKSYNE